MEEMNELFYQDSHMREFDAIVVSCTPEKDCWQVELDDTAFYPEGGGQPADHGTLNDAAVSDVRRKDGVILHRVDRQLEAGSMVHGVIDWKRRLDHMQQHSGEHIMSGLIHARYGLDNVGFHMGPEVTLIDFNGELTAEQVQAVELEANELIWQDVPVQVDFPTADQLQQLDYRSKKELTGTVRIVTIPGGDCCACCGTHVSHTGEIGLIKALSVSRHQGGTRIELVCGMRAYQDDVRKTEANQRIMNLLSAKRYETAEAVERLQKDAEEKGRNANLLAGRYLQARAASFPDHGGLLIDFEEGVGVHELREFGNQLIAAGKAETAALLSPADGDAWSYLILSSALDLRRLIPAVNQELNGRGGGRPDMVQGTLHGSRERIEEVLKEHLAAR